MNFKSVFIFTFITFLLSSCAGYHVNSYNNPLLGYDIKSISVPMFVNRTNIVGLSAPMTKEIVLSLQEYSGLKVIGGENDNTDAVLLGIIEAPQHINQTFKSSEPVFTEGDIKNSIGERAPFYYPTKTNYQFSVRFIFIKRPSKEEIELLTSDIGKSIKLHPKIVLEETLNFSGSFSRAVNKNINPGDPGEVNFVKNRGILEKSIFEISKEAANTFKQVVLNVF